jgi:mono/diheme cytochrome c family protein
MDRFAKPIKELISMVTNVTKRQVGVFTLFLTTVAFFFLSASAVFALEAERTDDRQTLEIADKTFSEGTVRKVGHEGLPHNDPVDFAEPPPGICPQERNTPKAPEPIYRMTNPLAPTAKNLQAGETLFKIDARPTACKVCHGFGGDGMGVIFEQLTPKPRNFTCYYTMDDIPDGQIYWIIKNGSPGTRMPSFGALNDKEVWQLALYIRQFSLKNK